MTTNNPAQEPALNLAPVTPPETNPDAESAPAPLAISPEAFPAAGAGKSIAIPESQIPASAPIRGSNPRAASPLKLLIKLCRILTELDWVEKRGWNEHFRYWYATESDILAAIRPRLAHENIFAQTLIVDETATPTGKISEKNVPTMRHRVELLVIFHDADSGETMDVRGIGYANDDADKGFYKAYTGAIKYAFGKTFLISSGDDPEADGAEEKAEKKSKGKPGPDKPGPSGAPADSPQRKSGAPVFEEGVPFQYTGPVPEYTKSKTRDQKWRYLFKLPDGIGASTVNEKLAQDLIAQKAGGVHLKWTIVRTGSFFNIQSVGPNT